MSLHSFQNIPINFKLFDILCCNKLFCSAFNIKCYFYDFYIPFILTYISEQS